LAKVLNILLLIFLPGTYSFWFQYSMAIQLCLFRICRFKLYFL